VATEPILRRPSKLAGIVFKQLASFAWSCRPLPAFLRAPDIRRVWACPRLVSKCDLCFHLKKTPFRLMSSTTTNVCFGDSQSVSKTGLPGISPHLHIAFRHDCAFRYPPLSLPGVRNVALQEIALDPRVFVQYTDVNCRDCRAE
jgi:hypothetical protein